MCTFLLARNELSKKTILHAQIHTFQEDVVYKVFKYFSLSNAWVSLKLLFSQMGTRYDWTQQQQGYIHSAFACGYIITHIPGALLAQNFGGKWVLGLNVLATTICNAAIPIGVEYGEF